jgi:sugar (pentulose or hexulose) kinase
MDENLQAPFDDICMGDARLFEKLDVASGKLESAGISMEDYTRITSLFAAPTFMALHEKLKESDPEKYASVKKWTDDTQPAVVHALTGEYVGQETYAHHTCIRDVFARVDNESLYRAFGIDPDLFIETKVTGELCGTVTA